MSNPLFDTLFRPTTPPKSAQSAPPPIASAPPVRAKGVHTRAGNAMSRTRTALLSGAGRAVEVSGTKIAMAQVAASAGVAKATLYNHFRTREAVLAALVVEQVRAIADEQVDKPVDIALTDAALAISRNPVRRGLARIEPGTLAEMSVLDGSAEGWQLARAAVAGTLAAAGLGGVDTVLRWLASFLVSPGSAASIGSDVAVLLHGLPAAEPARGADGLTQPA